MSQNITELTNDYPSIADLPEDERYGLLVAERRRSALTILAERTAPIELAELATVIAAREDESDPADEEAVDRIELALHHAHLPKMDELGVIDYDPDSHLIVP